MQRGDEGVILAWHVFPAWKHAVWEDVVKTGGVYEWHGLRAMRMIGDWLTSLHGIRLVPQVLHDLDGAVLALIYRFY